MDLNKLLDVNTNLWISANAGSGKTTQLVNRFLLLLQNGYKVNEIVCITYTEAGAKEMKTRIINEAERQNINIEEWQLNISTIHGFCKRLLTINGFISADIQILNDDKYQMQKIIKDIIEKLNNQSVDVNEQFEKVITDLAKTESITQFQNLVEEIITNQNWFLSLFTKICSSYDTITINDILNNIDLKKIKFLLPTKLQQFVGYDQKLKEISRVLQQQLLNQDKDVLLDIANKLAGTPKKPLKIANNEIYKLENWQNIVLTKDNKIRKKAQSCEISLIQEIMQYFVEKLRQYGIDTTYSSLFFAYAVLMVYQDIKNKKNVVSYDDMLFQTNQALNTKQLFNKNIKDNGSNITYLMLDEAQDTNPISWQIIEKLIKETKCKFFVVGDKKQSIYRFQGARVEEYEINERVFKQLSKDNNVEFCNTIKLNTSYRSTQEILNYVDDFCNSIQNKIAFSITNIDSRIEHYSGIDKNSKPSGYFLNQENTIINENISEYLDDKNLEEYEDNGKQNEWVNRTRKLFLKQQERQKNVEKIADKIASYIKVYEDDKKNGIIDANDKIAIVYPTRSAKGDLIFDIVSVLQDKYHFNFDFKPDVLKKSIYYHDIVSLLEFAILQNDDANLACLLKSDIFNFTDEMLMYVINNDTKNTLWNKLKCVISTEDAYKSKINFAVDVLKNIISSSSMNEILNYIENVLKDKLQYEIAFFMIKEFFEKNNYKYNYDFRGFLYELENANFKDMNSTVWENKKKDICLSTIHGVKGMEFDTVILIKLNDNNSGQNKKRLFFLKDYFWYKTGSCKLQEDDIFCEDLLLDMQTQKEQDEYESKRLEYVAITRAKRRICIFRTKDNEQIEIDD